MNVVPFPSWLSKVTVPANASVIRLTTGKPNPWPFALVVNIGVNNLFFSSSGTPTPVSWTFITMSLSSLSAITVSLPRKKCGDLEENSNRVLQ